MIKGNQPNFLGRDLLNVVHIDWQSIFTNSFVNYVEDKHMDLNKILEEYREGFSLNLGVSKGVKIKIDVPEDVKPKYFKPRSVPCALKDAIGCELDKRVRQGIFKPVNHCK